MPGMAGGGLPDAEQQILADASVYLDEFKKVRGENKSVEESNKALGASFGKLAEDITKVERELRDLGRNREIVRNFVEMQKAIDAAYEANQRFTANPAEIEDHTHLIQEATKAYQDAAGATEFFTKATTRHIEETIKADEATDLHIQTTKELTAAREKALTVARDLADAHRQVNNEMLRARDIAQARGIDVGGSGYLAGPAFGAGSRGTGPADGGLAASTMRAIAADEASRRYSSIIPSLLAGGGLGALGGLIAARGGGFGTGLGTAASAIGGGIGNIGGAIGGAMGSGPTAADTSRVVTGFMRRWYPAAHWAMMLTNELLATVGPAVAAGGMGALTGMQGFEQLIPRGRAVFRASEALGPSTGMTTGKAWGLHTAYLQNAQDLATGMATEMAGSFVNMLNAPGAGSAFTQLGLNTDAMFSRFLATLTLRFQKGGLGGQLGNLVTGGTGYLQQFGDVLANLGNTFLNTAPNLPGVGGDLLSLLSGGTGALASGTHWLGGMLGPLLAGEAGMRWGPAILGTAGRATAGLGNILGNAGRGGWLSRIGLGTGTEGGLAGIGAAIGGLSAPEIGAIAAGAFYLNKAYTYQTPQQVAANQALTQIGQMGFVPGYSAGITQMQAWSQVKPGGNIAAGSSLGNIAGGLGAIYSGVNAWSPGQVWGGAVRAGHGVLQMVRTAMGGGTQFDPTAGDVAQIAMDKLAGSMVSALAAGGQIQTQWQALSGHAISMGKATDVATMAQLQLGTAFQKNGMLSDQAKMMISNLYAGYAPMHMNSGMFGAAVGAQTAMAGLQHTQIAAVNQAYDQLTQMVTGGGASAATLFGLLGGAPVGSTRGRAVGVTLAAAAKGNRQFASSLGSFISPGGAAAWNTLTNQQGIFPALEAQLGWLRTAQTMGSLTAGQTTAMAGFDIAQIMPRLGHNPAALAMLSSYAQEFGGPGFAPGASGSTMAKALRQWISGGGGLTGKGYNRLMTLGTQGLANIGVDANQFVQNLGSGIGGPMAAGIFTHGEDLMKTFMSVAGHRGSSAALSNLANFMFGSGTPLAGAQSMVKVAATRAGVSPQSIQSMMGQLKHEYDVYIKIHADTGALNQIKSQVAGVKFAVPSVKVQVHADGVATASQQIQGIKGKTVMVTAAARGVGAAQAAINSVHGKVVDIVVNTIMTGGSVSQAAMQAAGYAPGVSASQIASGIRKSTPPGGQRGMKIPGYGGGDIWPAMLEPGELVVPKHMVAAGLADHLRGTIPGFAGGGFVGQQAYGPGAYWGTGSKMALWNPALLAQLLAAMQAAEGGMGGFPRMPVAHPMGLFGALTGGGTIVHPQAPHGTARSAGSQFAVEVLSGMKDGLKKAEAHKLAAELIAKLEKEVRYATGVANAAAYGQGFDPTGRGSGIFGSMTFTNSAGLTAAQLHSSPTGNIKDYNAYVAAFAAGDPGQAPKSAQQQMQDYLKTLRSFSSDITKLRKMHLSKDVMAQIIAAGPEQGDQIAKSILGGQGGAGAVNKLWQQIQKASKGLGAQAAMAQYGGHLSPDLRHGQVSIGGVTINVNVGGGKGGTLDLTPQQIAQIVAAVQAALLKQAKRNNKTGIKLAGKGS